MILILLLLLLLISCGTTRPALGEPDSGSKSMMMMSQIMIKNEEKSLT
jgi:hypothetical protein